jgi:glycosyltransferase involved in cell wall biosynthesis
MAIDINRKLKVAQVITRMDWGGAPDVVRLICEGLDSEYDWKLIIGKSQNITLANHNFLEKYKQKIIIVPNLQRDIDLFQDFKALFKLYSIFKKERFNIVHLHTAKAGFLGRIAAKMAGVKKTVYMPHGHVFYGYFGRILNIFILLLERFAGCLTDKIIVLTKLEKNDFILRGIKKDKDIDMICPGLEINILNKVKSSDRFKIREAWGVGVKDKVVGLVSRLEAVKGPAYFVKAAALIAKDFPGVKFIIAGEGSLKSDLERLSEELGLIEKIKFLGWRDNSLEIISALDILVQPSLNEAVGRVLQEAQALGVAVVASRTGGIPEIVKDEVVGLLVEPGNYQAIAQAIKELLKDDRLRNDMALAGRDWARDNFDSKKMVINIKDIYKGLL